MTPVTTQTAQSVPPTAPSASTATMTTDHLDRGRQLRPTSPAFMMNTIPDNWPGPTTNPLLVVNTGQDGNTNSFITPTLATNRQNHQGNRNTVAFKNTTPETNKEINARLIEIANQGPDTGNHGDQLPRSPHSRQMPLYELHGVASISEYVLQSKQILQQQLQLKPTDRHGKTTRTEHATIVAQRGI